MNNEQLVNTNDKIYAVAVNCKVSPSHNPPFVRRREGNARFSPLWAELRVPVRVEEGEIFNRVSTIRYEEAKT